MPVPFCDKPEATFGRVPPPPPNSFPVFVAHPLLGPEWTLLLMGSIGEGGLITVLMGDGLTDGRNSSKMDKIMSIQEILKI